MTCSSSKVLVTFNRITKSYSSQESFKLYQGSVTSGTLLFTQPTILDNQSYTWRICLSSGIHTIQLLDSGSNGWTSNSIVKLYINDILYDTYQLSSGSSTTYQFTITEVSTFTYPYSSIILVKNKPFSITPSISGTTNSFSVSSGSLPSGLSLNSNTGVISGTPTNVNSYSATIKAISHINYKTFSLSFSVVSNPTSCSSSKVFVTFNRITTTFATEESFKIYQGSSTSGSLVFTQPSVFDDQSYTWNACLSTGTYTLQLK